MDFIIDFLADLFASFGALTWKQVVMWIIGGVLIFLAIKKEMEPTLLLPMGFGAILVNIPFPALSVNTALLQNFLKRVSPTNSSRSSSLSVSVR